MKTSAILSIPVQLDLHKQIIAAGEATKMSRSEVMRQAIRIGLPYLLSGLALPSGATTTKAPRGRKAC